MVFRRSLVQIARRKQLVQKSGGLGQDRIRLKLEILLGCYSERLAVGSQLYPALERFNWIWARFQLPRTLCIYGDRQTEIAVISRNA